MTFGGKIGPQLVLILFEIKQINKRDKKSFESNYPPKKRKKNVSYVEVSLGIVDLSF